MPGISEINRSRGPAGLSDGPSTEKSFGATDAMPSCIQPASGYQSVWMGAPGQVSMVDIVKMDRPHNKASNAPNASHQNLRFLEDRASKDAESRISSVQHLPTNEEWLSIEKPAVTKVISVPEYIVDSEQHIEAPGLPADSINRPSEAEEVEEVEDDDSENSGAINVGSDCISSRKTPEDDSRSASLFENDLYKKNGFLPASDS